VGKSSLLNLYSNNEASINIAPTLGCDYQTKEEIVDGKKINLFIWDTAG
jgi:GTPase SAR1 family protein